MRRNQWWWAPLFVGPALVFLLYLAGSTVFAVLDERDKALSALSDAEGQLEVLAARIDHQSVEIAALREQVIALGGVPVEIPVSGGELTPSAPASSPPAAVQGGSPTPSSTPTTNTGPVSDPTPPPPDDPPPTSPPPPPPPPPDDPPPPPVDIPLIPPICLPGPLGCIG